MSPLSKVANLQFINAEGTANPRFMLSCSKRGLEMLKHLKREAGRLGACYESI